MLPPPEKFDPIYAAVVGALIAMVSGFFTALIVGWQARKRQKTDLKHSAEQKELERVHSLKREVYLPFSDALAAAVGFVPTIPTCPIDSARGRRGRSEFIRDALAACLTRMGIPLSPGAGSVPDRVFTHHAKVGKSSLNEDPPHPRKIPPR